uniref:Peroxidase n=1 Tax=Steinernema glaseri TaxID=37863 RepID=A0A1I8ARP9_9BILA
MKNLTVVFIVAKDLNSEGTDAHSTEAVNGVRRFLVADSTAKILLNVVNEYPDIKPMDILKVTSAYTMVYKDKLTLCCGKNATIMKTGEFMMPIGMKNMSEERRTEGTLEDEFSRSILLNGSCKWRTLVPCS